jgi:glutamate N-acetyltransferase/amino-acid N-acetyltransferase
VATDAVVADAAALAGSLRRVADHTFNRVTVDGDTSTNDTLLVMANGAAGGAALSSDVLDALLFEVCDPLARALAEDGEGATKLVHVHVKGARSEGEADAAARSVANSPLVKTALFAADANWGRIICAVGNSGARVSTDRVALSFDDAPLLAEGRWLGPEAEVAVAEVMNRREYTLTIDLAVPDGEACATVHTCDFSYDYVKINAEYRT